MGRMRFLKLVSLLPALALLGGCGEPPRWMQFYADGQGRGFVGVHSSPATSAMWFADVGPAGFSSPSLQLDGTIYVGNHNGELVVTAPCGSGNEQRTFLRLSRLNRTLSPGPLLSPMP